MPTPTPSPLMAALSAPVPLAAKAGRPVPSQASASFSQHLEQMREARAHEPARERTPEKPRSPTSRQPQPSRPRDHAAERLSHQDDRPRKAVESRHKNDGTRPERAESADSVDSVDSADSAAAQTDNPAAQPVVPESLAALLSSTTVEAESTSTASARDANPMDPAAMLAPDRGTAPETAVVEPGSKALRVAAGSGQLALERARQTEPVSAEPELQPEPASEGLAPALRQAQAATLLTNNAQQAASTEHDASAATVGASPTLVAALPGLAHSSTHAAGSAAPVGVHLATPTSSADFRSALGLQVSLLAARGVQSAELHLNPAEMGPVSIQILLDGRHAQVNFGADSAQTRQLIESGMPELASALRDAGLTLTGGGVSQHGGGRRGEPGSEPATEEHQADGEPVAAQNVTSAERHRSRARIAAGGIDMYA
jgi:flagellar hook-length control protein FliK